MCYVYSSDNYLATTIQMYVLYYYYKGYSIPTSIVHPGGRTQMPKKTLVGFKSEVVTLWLVVIEGLAHFAGL